MVEDEEIANENYGEISPLYKEENRESEIEIDYLYVMREGIILDQYPEVKKEPASGEEIAGDDEVELDQWPSSGEHTPPRSFIFEENVRNTPVKQRVGPTNDEIKREKQKTMSAKDRLGSRNSGQIHNRLERKHVLNRIKPISDADHFDQREFDQSRIGRTNRMPREVQRRSK